MGSIIEINDTLQITQEQGFPTELDFEMHKKAPYSAEQFKNQVFEFHGKKSARVFQLPPVRVFLAQNINGKWLYWGHVEILEIRIDGIKKETSGKFRITKIFTVEEMKLTYNMLDGSLDTNYFK